MLHFMTCQWMGHHSYCTVTDNQVIAGHKHVWLQESRESYSSPMMDTHHHHRGQCYLEYVWLLSPMFLIFRQEPPGDLQGWWRRSLCPQHGGHAPEQLWPPLQTSALRNSVTESEVIQSRGIRRKERETKSGTDRILLSSSGSGLALSGSLCLLLCDCDSVTWAWS